jgi:hypothetical protein
MTKIKNLSSVDSRPGEDTRAYTVYTGEGRGESFVRRRNVRRRVEDLKGEII